MKSRNIFSVIFKIITHGCVYYTIASLLLYVGGLLFSTIEREWIPTLDMLLLLLVFTISFSAVNQMVLHTKLPAALKLLIHYAVTLLIFYVSFIWWGGFSDSGSSVLVILLAFTLLYGIGALVFFIVRHVRDGAKNSRTAYDAQFTK